MSLIRKMERSSKRLLIRGIARVVKTEKLSPCEVARSHPRRILVIRQHNQMGDMLLSVPALRALRESFPQAQIGIVASTINRDVLSNNPYVDFLFSYNKRNPLSHLRLLKDIRNLRFDLVIVLHTVSFSFTSSLLACLSGAKMRAGSTSRPFGHKLSESIFHLELPLPSARELERLSETEHNLYPLFPLGVKTDDLSPVLIPSKEDEGWADNFFSTLGSKGSIVLAVHPGAGKRENIWPPENFAGVVNEMARVRSVTLIVIEGPRDGREVRTLCRLSQVRPTVVRGRRIGEVAALLKRTDLVLCNDTGVMHVSVAAGARTLAIFGPTNPVRWAPRSLNLHVVRAPRGDLGSLREEAVIEKVFVILSLESGAQGYFQR